MTTSKVTFEWKCPRCSAPANEHGKGGRDRCIDKGASSSCSGFICECWEDEGEDRTKYEAEDHGHSLDNPCRHANCYHCGYGGTFPKAPKGLQPWEKKALEAGWLMPDARKAELGL